MRETEKMMIQLDKFMKLHEDEYPSEEEAMEAFMAISNEAGVKGEAFVVGELTDKEKAMEELEKLEFASSQREYTTILNRALKLDPENLDALLLKLDDESNDFIHELGKLVTFGQSLMKKEGLDDENDIGRYWGIIETRPYMRIKMTYAEELKDHRMLTAAAKEYEDMLRLSEQDNLGARYQLMAVYCQLEQLEKAKELHTRFDDDSAQMLLPLILLSLKQGDELSAKRYYKELQQTNKDCRKVFGKINFDLEKMMEAVEGFTYRPYSEDDIYLAISLILPDFAFVPNMYYYEWLKKNLIKKTAPKKGIQKKK